MILAPSSVGAKLRRMAYEIYEANYGQDSLVLVGVDKRGGFLAKAIGGILEEISPLSIRLLAAPKDENGAVGLEGEGLEFEIGGKPVVVVDDVLYSGHTLFNAVAKILAFQPSRIQSAVLIDRGHRNVPVTHDFVGMLLATSLKQHVSVEILEDESSATAYLI